MKSFSLIVIIFLTFGSLSCGNTQDYNCFGVRIPEFKNPRVDSLVRVKEGILCKLVEKSEKGEEITFEEGLEYSNNGMRHLTIFEWLDKDGDQKEIDKYGAFNQIMGDKVSEFNKKIRANIKAKQ